MNDDSKLSYHFIGTDFKLNRLVHERLLKNKEADIHKQWSADPVASPISERSRHAISDAQSTEHEVGCVVHAVGSAPVINTA